MNRFGRSLRPRRGVSLTSVRCRDTPVKDSHFMLYYLDELHVRHRTPRFVTRKLRAPLACGRASCAALSGRPTRSQRTRSGRRDYADFFHSFCAYDCYARFLFDPRFFLEQRPPSTELRAEKGRPSQTTACTSTTSSTPWTTSDLLSLRFARLPLG